MKAVAKLRLVGSTLAIVASCAAAPAVAQTSAPAAPSTQTASENDSQPHDIIVTATKRNRNMQDVPVVVTSVDHTLLQDAGVKDIKDLATLTPGLLVTSTTSEASTTARIRGIGTVGDNPGLESSVGIVVDGVYRSRNGVGFGDLGNLDHIEVLKGPQGTLFGKSATAGVINIITEKPQFEYHANGSIEVGNYNDYGGDIEVTGPLIKDQLAGSLYFADRHRDGFFDVDTGPGPRTSTTDNNRNFYTIRGQLLATPTDNFTARIIGDYSHRNERCCMATIVRDSEGGFANSLVQALGGYDGNAAQPYARQAYANRPDGQKIGDGGVSLQLDWQTGPGTLTSITAYRDWKTTAGFDADFGTADIDYLPPDNSNSTEFKTFSQELRYAGSSKLVDWLVGGFYSNELLDQRSSVRVGSQFTPYLSLLFSELIDNPTGNPSFVPDPNFLHDGLTFPLVHGVNYNSGDGSLDRYHQTDNTYALFTDDTFHVATGLDLDLGLRYTIDRKTLDNYDNNIGGGAGCAAANAAFAILNGADPAAAEQLAAVNNTMCLPFLSPGYNNFYNFQDETEHNLSGTAKLSYRFNPQLMVYGSYARGYKAGGFNLDRVQCTIGLPGCAPGSAAALTPIRDTYFPDETNDAYEVGEKATLFDRKLLLNVALFYQKYKGFQLNTFTGLVFVVDSIPQVTSKGVDTDFVWFASHNLSFQGGVTYADTRYDLTTDQLMDLKNVTGFQGGAHSRLSLAPLWSASLSGTYTQDVGSTYKVLLNLGGKYSSDYNTGSDLDPGKIQKAYVLLDGRIGFGPQNDLWRLEFWSHNMLNTNYKQVAFDSGFQNVPTNATGVLDAFLGDPRTFGATFRFKF